MITISAIVVFVKNRFAFVWHLHLRLVGTWFFIELLAEGFLEALRLLSTLQLPFIDFVLVAMTEEFVHRTIS